MGAKPASDTLLQQLAGQGGALPPGLLHCLSYHDSPRPRDQQQQPPVAAGKGHGLWQQQQGRGGDGPAAGAAVPQCAADEKRRQRKRQRRAANKARQQRNKADEAALQAQQQQQPVKQQQQQQRHRHRRQQRCQAPGRQRHHHQQQQAPASTLIRPLGGDTIRTVLVAAARAATGTKVQDVRGLADKLHLVHLVQAPGGDGGNGRTVQQVLSTSLNLGASAAGGPVQLAAKRSARVPIGVLAEMEWAVQQLLQRHGVAGVGGGQQHPQGQGRQGTAAAAASDGADAFTLWARSLPAALLGELLGDETARAALDGSAPGGAARWLQGALAFDMEVEVLPSGEVCARLLTVSAWAEGGTVAEEVARLADSVRAGEVGGAAAAVRTVQLMEQAACIPEVLEQCRLLWGDLKLENLVRVRCPGGGWQLRMIDVDDIKRLGPCSQQGAGAAAWRCAPVTGFYSATAFYMAPEMALGCLDDCQGTFRTLRGKHGVRCPAVKALADHLQAAWRREWWDAQGREVLPLLGELGACGGRPYVCMASDIFIFARCMQEALEALEQAMKAGVETGVVDAGGKAAWDEVCGALRGLAGRCLELQPSQRPGPEDIRRELCALLQ